MMLTLPEELRAAIKDSGNRPITAQDPETGEMYVVVSLKTYEELESTVLPDRLSDEEQDYLLREAGLRAGWDDPEMDIYNDLDPRKPA